MEKKSVFDAATPSTIYDVRKAANIIKRLIPQHLNKNVFRDMIIGFKTLLNSLLGNETEGFKAMIHWLALYVDIHRSIDPQNERLLKQFEQTVPTAATYIIGCLQEKLPDMATYHYRLLVMIYELLQNVSSETVEALANFQPGIIACLWFPIDFVGDFNTQMIALRLLVMLMKCVDANRQNEELANIRCARTKVLHKKLEAAIIVANYHQQVFENTARTLLNNYNMNLAKNVLVYSFRCKSLRLSDNHQFFKELGVEEFWIDLNYCPRTMSFNGRYMPNGCKKYVTVSVILKIREMTLQDQYLLLSFVPPAQFSKKLPNIQELKQLNEANIYMYSEEALRLQENDLVIEYYNKNVSNQTQNRSLDMNDGSECESVHLDINNNTQVSNANNAGYMSACDGLTRTCNSTTANLNKHAEESANSIVVILEDETNNNNNNTNSTRRTYPMTLRNNNNKRKVDASNQLCHEPQLKMKANTNNASQEQPLEIYLAAREQRLSGPIKQINKVQPLNHVQNHTDIVEESTTNPRYQRTARACLNMSNVLLNGNKNNNKTTEQNSLNNNRAPLNLGNSVYDICVDTSDAEPCQSYRNFIKRSKNAQNETGTLINTQVGKTDNSKRKPRRPYRRRTKKIEPPGQAAAEKLCQKSRTIRNPRSVKTKSKENDPIAVNNNSITTKRSKRRKPPNRDNLQLNNPNEPNTTDQNKFIDTTAISQSRISTSAKKLTGNDNVLKEFSHASNVNTNKSIRKELFKEQQPQQPEKSNTNVAGVSTQQEQQNTLNCSPNELVMRNDNLASQESILISGQLQNIDNIPTLSNDQSQQTQIDDSAKVFNENDYNSCCIHQRRDTASSSSSGEFSDIEVVRTVDEDAYKSLSPNMYIESVKSVTTKVTKMTKRRSRDGAIYTKHHQSINRNILVLESPSSYNSSINEMSMENDMEEIPANSLVPVNSMADITIAPLSPKSLKHESSVIIDGYQTYLNDNLTNLLQETKEQCFAAYKTNVRNLTKHVLEEAHTKGRELMEMKEHINRILSELDGLYVAYEKKAQTFQSFKGNAEKTLEILLETDIKKRTNNVFDKFVHKIHNASNELSAKQWKKYVMMSTENLMQDIADLSVL